MLAAHLETNAQWEYYQNNEKLDIQSNVRHYFQLS